MVILWLYNFPFETFLWDFLALGGLIDVGSSIRVVERVCSTFPSQKAKKLLPTLTSTTVLKQFALTLI